MSNGMPRDPICTIDGCEREHDSRGWCQMHYARWKKSGSPYIRGARVYAPAYVRFWRMVDKNGPVPADRPDLGPCWLWTGCTQKLGYGTFDQGKAHRWSWIDRNGPVPEGLELDHLCRVRHCVKPSHLEAVTHAENMRRAREWKRNLKA